MKRFSEQEVEDINRAIESIEQSLASVERLHRMEVVKDYLFQSIDRLNEFLKENGDKK